MAPQFSATRRPVIHSRRTAVVQQVHSATQQAQRYARVGRVDRLHDRHVMARQRATHASVTGEGVVAAAPAIELF